MEVSLTDRPYFRMLSEAVGFSTDTVSPALVQIIGPARWPRLMSRVVLAEYLSISTSTLDKWVSIGMLPPPITDKSAGRAVRWDKNEVDALFDADRPKGPNFGKPFDAIVQPRKLRKD